MVRKWEIEQESVLGDLKKVVNWKMKSIGSLGNKWDEITIDI